MRHTLTALGASTRTMIYISATALLFLFLALLQAPHLDHLLDRLTPLVHEFIFTGTAKPLSSHENFADRTFDFAVVITSDDDDAQSSVVKKVHVSRDVLPFGVLKRGRVGGNRVSVVSIPQLPGGNWDSAAVGVSPDGERVAVTGASCSH